jgi:integrase
MPSPPHIPHIAAGTVTLSPNAVKSFQQWADLFEEVQSLQILRVDLRFRVVRLLIIGLPRLDGGDGVSSISWHCSSAVRLTWDQWADGIRVDIDQDGDVLLLIDGDDQKNGQAQQYPVVVDFADFLMEIPKNDHTGFVFNPVGKRGTVSHRIDTVSDWIVAIGKKAGVKVDMRKPRKTKRKAGTQVTDVPVPVYASAHDLRRSFGFRWAMIVQSMVLRDLMRHSSVTTTEKYYVGINAKNTLKHLREAKNGLR